MSSISYSSAGGNKVEYPYKIGNIEWQNKAISAFVIGGLPIEGGLEIFGSIAVNYLLADNHELSKGRWAAFVKMPPHLPGRREWTLIGSGIGTQPLPAGELWSGEVPEDIIRQLESIFET